MRNEILIVQPDPRESAALRALLEERGYDVAEASSVEDARRAVEETRPDAIVLQWSNPLEVRALMDSLPRNGGGAPCTIVTAREEQLHEAVTALDMGAADCIRMPIQPFEFVARLSASLRRRSGVAHEQLTTGPLVLDKTVHCLCVNGTPVDLAPTEFRLLAFFLENAGRVFSRDEILKGAWPRSIRSGSRTVDVHVRRLRQVLEPFGCADMIQTVRSFGYRFRAPAD